jgi:hypothetical protein
VKNKNESFTGLGFTGGKLSMEKGAVKRLSKVILLRSR